MKSLALVLCLMVLSATPAKAAESDFDTLGGNSELLERAKKLNPEKSVEVVQDRMVDRRWRSEFSFEYTGTAGGESYVETRTLGGSYQMHITPRWSVGAKMSTAFNQLTPEAQSLIRDHQLIPDVDFQKGAMYGFINWYPIYGKMNLHELGVAQFDLYLTVGGGQIQLRSGNTNTVTAGAGIGFWLSQHFSSRFEMRGETFEVKRLEGPQRLQLTVATATIGYLL